jgi:peroxiredoxin
VLFLEEPEQKEPRNGARNWLIWFKDNYIPLIAIVVIVILAFILINPFFSNLVGEKAPDFSVTGTEGERFTLSDNTGKVIVLDLMSTTCPACIEEMKHLRGIYDRYSQDDVMIVTIDLDRSDSNSVLRDFKTEHNGNWTFARDTADVANKYKVNYTPTTVIIDKDGIIRYYGIGENSLQKLVEEIDKLI